MKVCGIYLITINANNGRKYYYVGQSTNCSKRKTSHFSFLNKGSHYNKKLSSCFNKYKNISFSILEEAPADMLTILEQWWINEMHGYKYCLNLAKDAEVAARGMKPSQETISKILSTKANWSHEKRTEISEKMRQKMLGRVFSEESKKKMSIATSGPGNSQYGKHHSEEHRKKQSDSLKRHLAERKAAGNPRPGRKWTKEQVEKRTATYKANKEAKRLLETYDEKK